MKEKHTSCEGCRFAAEPCASEVVKEGNEEAYLRCWQAHPTKFEKAFAKASVITAWVLSPFFYYALYLWISRLWRH